MERYTETINKASKIKNDPNDWSREHKHRYILTVFCQLLFFFIRRRI